MPRRYIVSGRVQGVGFRLFVSALARRMNVAGWVRNLPDGCVEVAGSAENDVLELFERELRRGPELSRVDSVEIHDISGGGWKGFEVRA